MHIVSFRAVGLCGFLAALCGACASSTDAPDPCADPESADYDFSVCEETPGAGGSVGAGGTLDAGRAGGSKAGGSKAGGSASGGMRVTTGGGSGAGGTKVEPLPIPDASPGTGYQPLASTGGPGTASDGVPPGMPDHLAIGIGEVEPEDTWVATTGVAWDFTYKYLTYDWARGWGSPGIPGSYASGLLNAFDANGVVPTIEYYVMNSMPGGGENAFYSKVQNKDTMREYFTAFKNLMERAKDYDKPVLVLLEADGFGFLENQTGGNSSAGAAVASTGLSDLAGLPNTVAGWGLAFLQIRKNVGAGKAVLGLHVSHWSSGIDLGTAGSVSNLQQYVDRGYGFLAPLGLTDNQTGYKYDVLVGDPSDRDADWYKLVGKNGSDGGGHWWDTSAGASTTSRSFNRYAEWLRLWRQKTKLRWVLWQIPCGNSMSPNNASGGYKDNRAEYWLATGAGANRQRFVDAGVIALLFGAGAGQQTGYANDNDYIRGNSATYLGSPLALP
jgi:hypothetical protein